MGQKVLKSALCMFFPYIYIIFKVFLTQKGLIDFLIKLTEFLFYILKTLPVAAKIYKGVGSAIVPHKGGGNK